MIEAHGHSLSREKKTKELDHLKIFGAPGANSERPAWAIEHHHSPQGDRNPDTHTFSDGAEMLRHIATHANVPEPSDE